MPGIACVAEYTTVLAQVRKAYKLYTLSIAKLLSSCILFRHSLQTVSCIVLALLLAILQFGE